MSVAILLDRAEITDLFSRLSRLLDEKRWDDAATVFDPDISVSSPRNGELRGIDELVEVMRRAGDPGELTQHLTTDLLVDLAGDEAVTSANSVVHFFRAGQTPHRTAGLRLDGVAVRTPAGWRLRESRTTLVWLRER
ncbi:SnoaL-like domain-containing protein [Lentzea xinjiangensis]|uniref:SnoaL-like domain-containing protein n=1 Tax=Lentzea xinjiangensis TaxID=402600 RepID=A0A1H9IC23_9PSEU|nr:nuclear transport factor 2 family protein [Lentzea xinjiangensis]SEQ72133.1 SnoaL-like domain-containing protein [Lentzea xinjiangensis]